MDLRLLLSPSLRNYKKNEEVTLRCTAGLQPSFTKIKCSSEDQHNSSEKHVYRGVWHGMDIRRGWIPIQSEVECLGKEGIKSSSASGALPAAPLCPS